MEKDSIKIIFVIFLYSLASLKLCILATRRIRISGRIFKATIVNFHLQYSYWYICRDATFFKIVFPRSFHSLCFTLWLRYLLFFVQWYVFCFRDVHRLPLLRWLRRPWRGLLPKPLLSARLLLSHTGWWLPRRSGSEEAVWDVRLPWKVLLRRGDGGTVAGCVWFWDIIVAIDLIRNLKESGSSFDVFWAFACRIECQFIQKTFFYEIFF